MRGTVLKFPHNRDSSGNRSHIARFLRTVPYCSITSEYFLCEDFHFLENCPLLINILDIQDLNDTKLGIYGIAVLYDGPGVYYHVFHN